jgi:anti-sigma regulatory factor (Ser/Thr protein kinase)
MQTEIEKLCEFLFREQIPSDSIFDSKLVASELVANVIKHSGGIASLHTEVRDGAIHLKIVSSNPYPLPEKGVCSDVYAENGRGLFLVDSVCQTRTQTPDGEILVSIAVKEIPTK